MPGHAPRAKLFYWRCPLCGGHVPRADAHCECGFPKAERHVGKHRRRRVSGRGLWVRLIVILGVTSAAVWYLLS